MEWRPRHLILFSSICLFGVLLKVLVYPHGFTVESPRYRTSSSNSFEAPKQNVWIELSETEAKDVYDFVFDELAHLNLTRQPENNYDNFIFTVETLRPNKTDAVSYLYEDAELPERWAKVAVSQNFAKIPHMVYYMVGPLPISEESKILPLSYIFNNGGNSVINPIQDFSAIMDFGKSIAKNLSDITEDLLGASINPDKPNDPDSLLCWPRGSRVAAGGLSLWFQIFKPGAGSGAKTLLPQGIYAKVDATGLDISDWTAGQLYYNGVLYDSEDDLRSALKDGEVHRTPRNMDGSWTETEDFDSDPDGRELPPPVSVQPHGPRYRLDRKQQFVSWFGFEFYISTAQATGLTLFDIRFKGERLMYELGLQEALSHYAGDDPMQGGLEFLDSFFGMGKSMYELVPGYDCPAYADYLDSKYYQTNNTFKLPNGICLFEYTSDHLLSRHTAQYSVTVSRNTYLVLRSVSTVGNYDYTIEYIFYLDGTLEVKVRASGFIFGAFYSTNPTKKEDEYGHRIHNALSSSMHDHVINFKADMDVAGPINDMVRLALEPMTASYPWDAPEVKERNTMHVVEHEVDEEVGLDWPKNSGELYLVYNSEKKNAWGERKAYRITSGTGVASTPHLTIVNSTTLGDSARWAEHDVWVLQRKDTEPRSADPLNWFAPLDPLIDFNKMANHESLKHDRGSSYDGDLVIYFNVGAHHVPHSGDIPNTLMHTSATSVMFIPHNFNDRDPSRESVQGARLQLKGKHSGGFAGEPDISDDLRDLRSRVTRSASEKKHRVKYFGTPYAKGMKLPLEAFEPDLQKFKSSRIDVSELSFNGSAAGLWVKHNP